MEREKIRESLDTVARERGAGKRDLWPGVEGRVRAGERQKSVARGEWMPLPGGSGARRGGFNFGLAGVMTLLLLGIGGLALMLGLISSNRAAMVLDNSPVLVAATATPQPTSNLPSDDPGGSKWGFEGHDNIYRRSSYVQISETRGGYTVTLERAYADANSVVVFFSITRVEGSRASLMHTEKALRMTDGTVLRQIYQGNALSVTSGPLDTWRGVRDTHLWAFDTAGQSDLPDSLSLNLTLNYMKAEEYEKAHKTADAVSTSFEETDARMRALSTQVEFNFEVPVTKVGTRVLELNQSQVVNGETLTLERVVITPVEFRAIVRYHRSKEDEDKRVGRTNVWLSTGNPTFDARQQVPPMGYGPMVDRNETTIVHLVVWPFDDLSGEWTLHVYALQLVQIEPLPTPGTWPPTKSIQGQWEFKFTVPPSER